MKNLDTFTLGYIECALWSSTDESTENGGEPLDKNYSAEDIAPDALARMVADCEKFQRDNAKLLDVVYVAYRYDESNAGHDLWLTRNGHGAGFWDRNLGDLGEKLTKACKKIGECNLYVGDDELIHVG